MRRMRSKSVHLVHANGNHRIIKTGFCWGGFFVPSLWAISEGLWRPFAVSALFMNLVTLFSNAADDLERRSHSDLGSLMSLLAVVSTSAYLLTMLCCGLFGKRWIVGRLIKHGYAEHDFLPARQSSLADQAGGS